MIMALQTMVTRDDRVRPGRADGERAKRRHAAQHHPADRELRGPPSDLHRHHRTRVGTRRDSCSMASPEATVWRSTQSSYGSARPRSATPAEVSFVEQTVLEVLGRTMATPTGPFPSPAPRTSPECSPRYLERSSPSVPSGWGGPALRRSTTAGTRLDSPCSPRRGPARGARAAPAALGVPARNSEDGHDPPHPTSTPAAALLAIGFGHRPGVVRLASTRSSCRSSRPSSSIQATTCRVLSSLAVFRRRDSWPGVAG